MNAYGAILARPTCRSERKAAIDLNRIRLGDLEVESNRMKRPFRRGLGTSAGIKSFFKAGDSV
jgi:hypothetical protein